MNTNVEIAGSVVEQEESSPYSPRTCGHGYFHYGLVLSIIFICYTFFIGGNDQTFSKFYFTYLKSEKFHISTGAASWGIILYWLSYSVSLSILMNKRTKKHRFSSIDWSINCSDCLDISLREHLFEYCLVWRFMSCCSLGNLRLGSGFKWNKFIHPRCCNRSCLCTNISIILWIFQSTIKRRTDVNRVIIMWISIRSIYISKSRR